jgi:hypothetical protein
MDDARLPDHLRDLVIPRTTKIDDAPGDVLLTQIAELRRKVQPNSDSAKYLDAFRDALALEDAKRMLSSVGSPITTPISDDPNGASSINGQKDKLEWLAKAMLLVNKNPEKSDAQIAKEVGRHPSQLSRSNEYQAAAKYAREKAIDKGYRKAAADGGGIESYSSEDDPANTDWDS